MNRKLHVTFLLFLLLCSKNGFAQFYSVKGVVTNSMLEPIAYVHVSVEGNETQRTFTDIKGNYEFKLADGSYVLIFTLSNFKTLKMPVTLSGKDAELNVILEEKVSELKGAKVSSKRQDRSEEIIRKVIENKNKFNQIESYSVDAYIKATETEESTRKKSEKDSLRELKLQQKDTSLFKKDTTKAKQYFGGLNMAEVFLTVHISPPDKLKEERKGVDIRGARAGLFYLTHTDGNFNFYRNLVEVPALSSMPILSPISNSGLIAYKYRLMKVFEENGKTYYQIKVTPGLMGNALVSGELIIEDSIWCVKSLKLSFPKYHMVEYDFFEVKQEYQLIDSHFVYSKQEFTYKAKYGKTASSGRTAVYYSNYKFNEKYKKKFFNNELSSTTKEAYERDSNFWKTKRLEPYTPKELAFIRRSDSLKAVFSQTKFRDSADSVYNRITFKKVFLTGQGNYFRKKERNWEFKPLATIYTPIYIAGPRFNYWVAYEREFKNKTYLAASVSPSFGTINKDLKGSFSIYHLYDPFKRAYFSLSAGQDFGIINPVTSYLAIFSRNNFYIHEYVNAFHRIEIFNGFYVGAGAGYANRRSMEGMKFDSRGDSIFYNSNGVVKFPYYSALYGTMQLYYVPGQKYIREPFRKLILGSKWPEFSFRYRKGINELGSVVDFDYTEFAVEQEMKIGLAGISKYRFISGEFLNSRDLRLVDQKFHRWVGPVFFANPLYSFQGIDKSFSTLKRFYEGHYFHRFNGSIINKIPILKKLNIVEVAGGGFLFAKDTVSQFSDPIRSYTAPMRYAEVFVGFEKIIRIWKERLRLGVFLVYAESNRFTYRPQIKFTIESYSNLSNKWPY